MVCCFNTAFSDKKGDMITNHKKIAVNYLKTWFIIDFMSNLPVEYLVQWFSNGEEFNGPYLRLLRVS